MAGSSRFRPSFFSSPGRYRCRSQLNVSPALRELHHPSSANSRPLTQPEHLFTDPTIERKHVIVRYLQLIVHKTVGDDAFTRRQAGSLLDRILLTEYLDLVKFLQKWGCNDYMLDTHAMLRLGLALIRACVDRTLDPLDIFVLGAKIDERDVCATAIAAGCFADRVYHTESGEYREVVWGVKQLPERFMQLCSPSYVDAFIRTIRVYWNTSGTIQSGRTLPFDFLQDRFCRFRESPDL